MATVKRYEKIPTYAVRVQLLKGDYISHTSEKDMDSDHFKTIEVMQERTLHFDNSNSEYSVPEAPAALTFVDVIDAMYKHTP